MDERVFFERGNVKVTNARFIVDAQTYAMNGVTSVKQGMTPPNRTLAVVLVLIGLGMLIGAEGSSKLIGLLIGGAGVWMFVAQKAVHRVLLHSSSGEQQALSSTDAPYIADVIAALNQALIHRG